MSEPTVADTKPIEVELEEDKTYRWCACGLTRGTRFDDPLKGVAFMSRVSLDCLDKVRDEVVPSLELYLHVAPCHIHSVPLGNQGVVQTCDE